MQTSAKNLCRSLSNIARHILPSRSVNIGNFQIETTPNHPLRRYLAKYPLYDQFIPSLCTSLRGTVIDIGANIGDTMAAILNSNPELDVVCIEPDDHFYSILERNRKAVDQAGRVRSLKAFITNSSDSFRIIKNATNSTGHIEKIDSQTSTAQSLTFTELLNAVKLQSPALVKIDTDGFDAQILMSIADHVELHPNCSPILFFEMQTYLCERGFTDPDRQERQETYLDAIERLQSLGYGAIAALDNFGTPLTADTDIAFLRQLQNYIARSQVKNRFASIHFLDVVLYQQQHADSVSMAFQRLMEEK